MRDSMLLIIFILGVKLCFAQKDTSQIRRHNLLVGVKTDPILWYEFGYMQAGPRFKSFQIKGSFTKEIEYPRGQVLENSSYKTPNGYVTFKSIFSAIKPGFALIRYKEEKSTFYLFVNGLFGFSKNSLDILINDPLLGNTKLTHIEHNFHSSIELEASWHIHYKDIIDLKLGPLIGKPITQPVVFSGIYEGGFSRTEIYKPGIGYFKDLYIALNLGLAINIQRSKTFK